eukprot:TRINITY_DN32515_c0_g1_i1.p1 TRINITY_DN32515_c0_g1~~TRINITY_DN32515_c0_g1_i1.p1  ORF type:complete len:490 (+),score=134.06 TRINITY_DN32515_c0_g1_i1:34-1470(+)
MHRQAMLAVVQGASARPCRALPLGRLLQLRRSGGAATSEDAQGAPSGRTAGSKAFAETSIPDAKVFMEFGRDLNREWEKKHMTKHPLHQPGHVKYWERIPHPPQGSHVLDLGGLIQDVTVFKNINDTCKRIESDFNVKVYVLLAGDIGSFTSPHLAKRMGAYWNKLRSDSGEDPYENFVLVFASRKSGTMHTYVGRGVSLVFHPVWIHFAFRKIFKVYFRGREWDTKILEYVELFQAELKARKSRVQTQGWPALIFLYNYWWALLGTLVLTTLVLLDYAEYYRYWDARFCTKCQKFMEGHDDPAQLWSNMTLGQRKETDLDCVRYALWQCPTEDCETAFVEEVKWNSMRLDCLICKKCHHRCSKGERVVANAPDGDNFGEVLHVRSCKFCGFQEAWTSLIRASNSGGDSSHDRQSAGNYGSSTWLRFRFSALGRIMLGDIPSGELELRKGNAGVISSKEGAAASRRFYLPLFSVNERR